MASPHKHPTDNATRNDKMFCPFSFNNTGRKIIALDIVRKIEILAAIVP